MIDQTFIDCDFPQEIWGLKLDEVGCVTRHLTQLFYKIFVIQENSLEVQTEINHVKRE